MDPFVDETNDSFKGDISIRVNRTTKKSTPFIKANRDPRILLKIVRFRSFKTPSRRRRIIWTIRRMIMITNIYARNMERPDPRPKLVTRAFWNMGAYLPANTKHTTTPAS
jgi:hypothetical protein